MVCVGSRVAGVVLKIRMTHPLFAATEIQRTKRRKARAREATSTTPAAAALAGLPLTAVELIFGSSLTGAATAYRSRIAGTAGVGRRLARPHARKRVHTRT
jgi:hypothetical protein